MKKEKPNTLPPEGALGDVGKGGGVRKRIVGSSTFGVAIILLALCIILTITTGDKFLSSENFLSVFRQFSFTAIMAIGVCLVIITGGIDLSLGSVYAFSGVMSGIAMHWWNLGTAGGLAVGALSGICFGFANGLFITKLQLPPFIATLGTMSIARGVAHGITGGYPISKLERGFKFIGQGYIAGIPAPIVLLVILAVITSFCLRKTILGRHIYAVGGNEEAARVSGVRVDRVKLFVYAFSGLMASIAGMATAARLGVAQSTAGDGMEMDAIAACIIGGASVTGGVGNILGPILGAAIMGVLKNGLVLLSISAYWQKAVMGAVIIIAVTADCMRNRKK